MAAERVSLAHFEKTFSYRQLRKHTAKEPLRGTSLRQLHIHTASVRQLSREARTCGRSCNSPPLPWKCFSMEYC